MALQSTSIDESLPCQLDAPMNSLNNYLISQDRSTCWTDDLPVCQFSGVGTATNQIYRENGFRREGHEFEDRSFIFRMDNDICLYGVFDGNDGSRVSAFAAQNMPAEILLGQLGNRNSDEDMKEVLRQACTAVEKSYFELLDNSVAERISLSQQIPEGLTVESIQQSHPDIYKRLKEIDAELNGGSAVLLSLIIHDRLYVANIGCCRALLCKRSSDGHLRVIQLTADHNLNNANELGRLANLGIDVDKVKQARKLAGRFYTRSIGDYMIKHEYRKIELLSTASSCPLIAEPEIFGGFDIDPSCCFLALMSDGLYRTVYDAVGSDSQVNAEIAGIIAAQFESQSTYRDVAQATVDQVVRQHYHVFGSSPSSTATGVARSRAHDDITLVVRGFGFRPALQAADSITTPTAMVSASGRLGLPAATPIAPLSIAIPLPVPSTSEDSPPRPFFGGVVPVNRTATTGDYVSCSAADDDEACEEDCSPSYEDNTTPSMEETARAMAALDLDESGRVASYVDFGEFDAAVSSMSDAEREALLVELELKPDFEPIPEEHELTCVA